MPNNLNVPNTPHNPLLCDTVHRRDHSNALILPEPHIFQKAVIPVLCNHLCNHLRNIRKIIFGTNQFVI